MIEVKAGAWRREQDAGVRDGLPFHSSTASSKNNRRRRARCCGGWWEKRKGVGGKKHKQ